MEWIGSKSAIKH